MGIHDGQSSCEQEVIIAEQLSHHDELEPLESATPTEHADLRLLRKCVPGMQALPKDERRMAAKHFEKMSFPAGHIFFEQGTKAKKAVYVISHGTVSRYCRDISKFSGLPMPGARRQNVLGKGDIFGCLGKSALEPFTVQCDKDCIVFCVTAKALKTLVPRSVLDEIRLHLSQDAAWHSEQIEAIPSTPSSSPKALRRSLSANISRSSHVQMPAVLPQSLVRCKSPERLPDRTQMPAVLPQMSLGHCKSPERVPDRAWLDELNRVMRGVSRFDDVQPPVEHSLYSRRKSNANSLIRYPRTLSTPSFTKADACITKSLAEGQRKLPAIGPFLD